MISTRSQIIDQTERKAASSRRCAVHASDVLLLISLGLWALGISRTNASVLGAYGLLPDLPVTVYLGVALLVISAAIELTRDRPPSRWRMSAHVVGLVTMLYATAPLVYPEGRYSWLYKTIGVVQYVNQHGHLNNQIDIYQNWPGFFALAAWFGKVTGLASPLSYAKWAQLVFELAALPILYVTYQAVSLSIRQRWLALLLYPAANWIGQDYYSPQALGTLLSLGIMALAMRWLYMGNRAQFADMRPARAQAKASLSSESANSISRLEMWRAYEAVKAEQILPGVDGVTIDHFETDLQNNLVKLCTVMSSGTYLPAPLRMERVPSEFGDAPLVIPTLADRIAQTVVARKLKTHMTELASREQNSLPRSAVRDANQNLQSTLTIDFRAVADDCPHSLILRAVEATSEHDWELLYVRRWLKAPIQRPDGSLSNRHRNIGTRIGPTISSVLDDLFLYYAIDIWLSRNFPDILFERNHHQAVAYCASEQRARIVQTAMAQRMEELGVRPPLFIFGTTRAEERTISRDMLSITPSSPRREQIYDSSPDLEAPENKRGFKESLSGSAAKTAAYASVVVLIYFVLTFTHELSPYILAIQIGVLAATGLLRPRLLAVILAAIAFGYLLPRLSYVNSHYGLLSSVGSFFRNVRPPRTTGGGPIPHSQKLLYDCSNALSAIMWMMALVGAWMRRRSRRTALTLSFLAFSPALILLLQAYGNEGVLRVYLFSLPWTAALAASALAPYRGLAKARRRQRKATSEWSQRIRQQGGTVRVAVALCIVLALFFPAFFGGDAADVMSTSEVATIASFMNGAPAGPVLVAIDNASISDTGRYNLFPLQSIFGADGALGNRAVTPNIAEELAQYAVAYTHGRSPVYVIVAPSMIAANQAAPVTAPESFKTLLSSLTRSRWWKLLVNNDGTIIYKISPGRLHVPAPTSSAPVPKFGLP